ncbi:MAG: LamG-like jellyroll fold domain-containing protein [Planctomycetota bacterium]
MSQLQTLIRCNRICIAIVPIALTWALFVPKAAMAELKAGAAVVDITPDQLPVLVNGGMLSRTASEIRTRVNARAIVLSDGSTKIGLVVVDSCMVPRILLDDAKRRASKRTGIPPNHIMVSATHTHTAPSAFGALGTDADPNYVPFLREKIAEALDEANRRLQPARVGWGSGRADQFTALRRWVRRPDRLEMDPFGNKSVRANMHAAKNKDYVTGPSGPEDPELSIIAFQTLDGKPIAALANFSMHYFGDRAISADYFGLFCDQLHQHATKAFPDAPMVTVLSHGCSGDIWRRDYVTWDGKDVSLENYTQGLSKIAADVFDSIQYQQDAELAMAETRLKMDYRVPDEQRLQWAQRIVDAMETPTPKDRLEVYAREQVLLDQMKSTEIVLQAIRIGEIAIATTPNETYALTGLKLKHRSPFEKTMVIELANGADGYIPPPEQHYLGGYNTWAARSAGLETSAEPRIVAADLSLLEQVTGLPRRTHRESIGPTAESILASSPIAYWRMAEMELGEAIDATANHHHGSYETGVCFFLPGATSGQGRSYVTDDQTNRSVHFAGGRMNAQIDELGGEFSITMEVWNGMPNDARPTTGWMFSRDYDHGTSEHGQHLGIAGTKHGPGKLIFQQGSNQPVIGKTEIPRWTWSRVRLVRQQGQVRVYLNESAEPEIDVAIGKPAIDIASLFIGGRSDNDSNWEGRIDEVVIEAMR